MEKVKEALKPLIEGAEQSLQKFFKDNKENPKYKDSNAVFNYRIYDTKEAVNFVTIQINLICSIWDKRVTFQICNNIPLHELLECINKNQLNCILGQMLSTILIRAINYDDAS